MPGMIGDDQVRHVKEATDLVQLIAEYVPVQRAGGSFKACCPFHSERTPSFQIYADAPQHYHCYGCGEHGDAISFVRAKENVSFLEAMEFLARRAGIELRIEEDAERQQQRGRRERLLAAHDWATGFYERCLWEDNDSAEARQYIFDRGFDEALCRQFRIGWSPGRNRLLMQAERQRADLELLLELDLLVERNGRPTDRFYERLMFPICDRFGHPVAFSGRLLPRAEQEAKEAGRGVGKYINSTETPLYRKGQVVFNMHQARGACREARRIVVMEGPTDVMAAAQAGMHECVAVLGTALTVDHARQLANAMSSRGDVLLLFDGDDAGQKNSIKAVRTFLTIGCPTQVAVMPQGLDPAELLKQGDGRQQFEAVIQSQRGDVDHVLRTLAPRPHQLDQRGILEVIDTLLDSLRSIADPDLRDGYIGAAARYLGQDEARLMQRLRRGANQDEEMSSLARGESSEQGPSLPDLDPQQETVLHGLVRSAELRGPAFDEWGVEPAAFPQPWRQVVSALMIDPTVTVDALVMEPHVADNSELSAALYRFVRDDRTRHQLPLHDPEPVIREAAGELRKRHTAQRDHRDVEHDMREAERAGNWQRAQELLNELTALKQQDQGR